MGLQPLALDLPFVSAERATLETMSPMLGQPCNSRAGWPFENTSTSSTSGNSSGASASTSSDMMSDFN